jgi:hypothetical protein
VKAPIRLCAFVALCLTLPPALAAQAPTQLNTEDHD